MERDKTRGVERRSSGPVWTTGQCCFFLLTQGNTNFFFQTTIRTTYVFIFVTSIVRGRKRRQGVRYVCVRISRTRVYRYVLPDVSVCNSIVFRFLRTRLTRGFSKRTTPVRRRRSRRQVRHTDIVGGGISGEIERVGEFCGE